MSPHQSPGSSPPSGQTSSSSTSSSSAHHDMATQQPHSSTQPRYMDWLNSITVKSRYHFNPCVLRIHIVVIFPWFACSHLSNFCAVLYNKFQRILWGFQYATACNFCWQSSPHWLPDIHFTKALSAHYLYLVKLQLALKWKIMTRSAHNLAHVMTAQLSWHVQNCELIGAIK